MTNNYVADTRFKDRVYAIRFYVFNLMQVQDRLAYLKHKSSKEDSTKEFCKVSANF